MSDVKPLTLIRAGLFNKLLPAIKDENNPGQSLQCETLPLGVPPILPSIKEKLHDILRDAQKNITYNVEPEKMIIPFELDHRLLFNFNIPQFQTEIREKFDLKTGEVIGYEEVFKDDDKNLKLFKEIPKNIPADIDDAQDLFDFCFPNFKHKENWIPDIEKLKRDLLVQTNGLADNLDILKISEVDDNVKAVDPKLNEILKLTSQKKSDLKSVQAGGESTTAKVSGKDAETVNTPTESGSVYKWARNVDISEEITDFKLKLPNLGHDWPFELDNFQKHAILHISKGNTVLVAAHTSAGKTVVAEYAIALSKRNKTRVVYTSPIKALSNQKFRDFKTTFGDDIGLITGDVYIKSNAFCLIMTTEILKVMLYTQDDLISELEWVIFDEVHYINDDERGVVWEEVFILLPPHVKMIFLSATAPNALQFADWIGSIKSRPIYVIYTSKRPVPLEHYLFVTNVMCNNNLAAQRCTHREPLMIMDAQNEFNHANLEIAKKDLEVAQQLSFKTYNNNYNTPRGGRGRGGPGSGRGQRGGPGGRGGLMSSQGASAYKGGSTNTVVVIKDKKIWVDIIRYLQAKNRMPAVVFVFSRKRIDHIVGNFDDQELTAKNERSKIHTFVKKCINKLNPIDKELPQVMYMQRLLIRGIGVHHSGILPLLKEMVEFLFHQSLIKILFATETFAMGLNMPAKTVLFESLRKFDGQGFRNMLPAEYIQMAGRAGRRGMDVTGSVFILSKDVILDEIELKMIMLGQPAKLESKFYLNYGMIMHLLQSKHMRAEDMMKRSFAEFYNQASVGDKREELAKVTEKVAHTPEFTCSTCLVDIENLYQTFKDYLTSQDNLMKRLYFHKHLGKLLPSGRLIVFKKYEENNPGHLSSAAKISAPLSDDGIKTFTMCLGLVLTINQQSTKPCLNVLYVEPLSNKHAGGGTLDDLTKIPALLNMLIKPREFLNNFIGPESLETQTNSKAGRLGMSLVKLEDTLYISSVAIKLHADKILEDARMFKQRFKASAQHKQQNFFHFAPPLLAQVRQKALERGAQSANAFVFDWDMSKALPDAELCEQLKQMRSQISILTDFKCLKCVFFTTGHFVQYYARAQTDELLARLKNFTTEETLQFLPEYNQRIESISHFFFGLFGSELTVLPKWYLVECVACFQEITKYLHLAVNSRLVLKKLEYIDDNLVSLMKGRVACCITNAEIVITELLFWNYFETLSPEEIVGVLSCLVCQEKNIETQSLTPELQKYKSDFMKIVSKIAQVEMECGLPSQNYLETFNFGLMEVVYQWAKGKPFKDLTSLTNAQEGAIVRCIQRLEEICHNVRSAARIIGETNLYKKMEEASFKIKRDIVFAASLYTTD